MIVEVAEEVWGCHHRPAKRDPVIALRWQAPSECRASPARTTKRTTCNAPTAVPRRPRRQPAAPGGAEEGARAARQGRDRRNRAARGRGPRDRARHQEAGRGRPAIDHRRRIPPLLVASRFPLGPRRRREARDGHRHPVCRRQHAQRGPQGHRQARLLRPSDARAFQVRRRAHQAHAQDHHPVAVGGLRPAAADADRPARSIRSSTPSSTISARPTKRRCAPSPMPAAAICSSTKCSSPCCATRSIAQQMKDRGDDPEKLGSLYGDLINTAMSDIPSDMTITMHLCRGNYKSTFMGAGGYEADAGGAVQPIKVHGYFMEYDTERAGGFEPLRLVPKDARWCSAWSPPRPAGWRPRTRSSAASTRRRSSFRSTSSACRRNAALPRPRRAMRWPRTSNGRSCA